MNLQVGSLKWLSTFLFFRDKKPAWDQYAGHRELITLKARGSIAIDTVPAIGQQGIHVVQLRLTALLSTPVST